MGNEDISLPDPSGEEGSENDSDRDPSGPIEAGPLDPTYSPSNEGATPMPQMASDSNQIAESSPSNSGSKSGSQSGSRSRPFWSSSGSGSGRTPLPHIGNVLAGRWEVGDRVGTGGMATVHAGVDLKLERAVAIKILHPHVAESPEARERLAREARAIAQLKHENVIEVYDYDVEDPECTWLITELIEGQSLRQFLDRHGKPMPEIAVMIVTEVLRALKIAHETGVIHRDVKPDNILIGKEGRPKLSDFGIAKVLNETQMTITGNLVGSPSYMSPEQADGLHTDQRTDLYSAGILLYRLVTGTLPFRGATPIDTIRKVSRGEYVDPVDVEPGCAGAIAGIIRRALSQNIDDRYQSADEMLKDLSQILLDAGLSATWEELPRYFVDPDGTQAELLPRLVKELEARGKALLDAGEENRAVDCFNRAMCLGSGNQRTLDLIHELSRRRHSGRLKRVAWATGVAIAAVAAITAVLALPDLLNQDQPQIIAEAAEEEEIPLVQPPPLERKAEPTPPPPEPEKTVEAKEPEKRPVKKKSKRARRSRKVPVAKAPPLPQQKEEEIGLPKAKMIAAGAPPTPPPAPKPPAFGHLWVGGKKWVDVYANNKKLGRTQHKNKYQLRPGIYSIKAVQPGSDCKPFYAKVEIAAGKRTKLLVKLSCP